MIVEDIAVHELDVRQERDTPIELDLMRNVENFVERLVMLLTPF